jgi:hypothetical protein
MNNSVCDIILKTNTYGIEELVAFIQQDNREFMTGMGRVSPQILIELRVQHLLLLMMQYSYLTLTI